jgi:hypothetical protein
LWRSVPATSSQGQRCTLRRDFFACALVARSGSFPACSRRTFGIAHLPRYDFFVFLLDGRVAILHRNVYAPAFFHLLGNGLKQPAD